MADHYEIDTHPLWEDGLAFALGALIALTPYLTGDAVSKAVQSASAFIGVVIMFAAFTERMQILCGEAEPAREWEEVLQALLGAILIALPFLYGYAGEGTLRYWHFALGGAVFVLAIVALRRDYVGEMRRHGWWRSL